MANKNIHLPQISAISAPSSAPPPLSIDTSTASPKRTLSAGRRGSPSKTPKEIKLPTYTAVYESAPQAAGVPVLELLRKLEEERILSRNDRIMVNEALKMPEKKEAITKAMRNIELGKNMHFAAKKLKAILYSNVGSSATGLKKASTKAVHPPGSAKPPSKYMDSPTSRSVASSRVTRKTAGTDDDHSVAPSVQTEALNMTKQAVTAVVGENPKYAAAAASPNVCLKIARRLRDFLVKYNPNTMGVRKFAVIVGSGSYNPLTRMHLRSYFLGKQHLESKSDYVVLGSLLSPGHPSTVRQRYRSCPNENMPPLHRLAIAQMCVESSKWMSVDPWEITRRRAMDYSSLLEHTSKMLIHNFPSIDIRVFYLCKSNAVPLLSPTFLREGNYGVICVTRPQESEQLRRSLGSRWNGLTYIADDTAILDASMDKVSAKNVRDRLKAGKSIVPLVGSKMAEYFDVHRIRDKMLGVEEWEEEEKELPKVNSRNMPPGAPSLRGEGGGENDDDNSSIDSPTSPSKGPSSPWRTALTSPRNSPRGADGVAQPPALDVVPEKQPV